MNILFLTWDGPQVSYLESLFVPVFERLAPLGFRFRVVQFTWADRGRTAAIRSACEARGVPYAAFPILRQAGALGALWSALRRVPALRRLVREQAVDVLMPRSVFCALVGLLVRRRGVRLVFDADGLPLDERVEFGGLDARGATYRVLRRVEAAAARSADAVLTRTAFARDVMRERAGAAADDPRFFVVRNGRDEALFRPFGAQSDRAVRATLGAGAEPLVVYAGSLGEQYCLAEMAAMMASIRARRPDARFLILTGELENGRRLQALCGGEATVATLPAETTASHLSAADLGLSFRRPSFSMRAVAPVKLGEYLLCGLPVLTTQGAEDLARPDGPVRALDAADPAEREQAADWFVNEVLPRRAEHRERARALGTARFGLTAMARDYEQALRGLRTGAEG